MADGGWIRVFRKLDSDHDSFWNPERKWCWISILMRAAYHDRRVSGVSLRRGQVLLSFTILEQDWGWTRDKVRYFLKQLIDRGSLKGNRRTDIGTVYDIPSYEDYQAPERRSTDETPVQNPTCGTTPEHHPPEIVEAAQVELLERFTNGPGTTPLAPPVAPPLQEVQEDTAEETSGNGSWRSDLERGLLEFWLKDQFPDGVRPPSSEIGKQRHFCRKITQMCDKPEQVVRAVAGIHSTWPFKPPRSEPWTPQRLLGRFSECQAAAVNRDELARAEKMADWVRSRS